MTAVRITHVGGPTTLIEFAGWRILTDPTFDPPGGTYGFGFGSHSTKLAGPAIAAADIGRLDAVLLTHEHHGDNLDAAGREILAKAAVVVTTVSGAARLGAEAHGLEPWSSHSLGKEGGPAVEVIATPCRHGPAFSHPIVGDVVGFALRWEGQEHGDLWISGDTVLYDGVREVADRLSVGLCLIHLGRVQFAVTGPVHYTLTAREAVELLTLIRPHTVVPVHYEGWSHFKEGRADLERELAAAPEEVRDAVRWVPIGEPVDLVA